MLTFFQVEEADEAKSEAKKNSKAEGDEDQLRPKSPRRTASKTGTKEKQKEDKEDEEAETKESHPKKQTEKKPPTPQRRGSKVDGETAKPISPRRASSKVERKLSQVQSKEKKKSLLL
jgi:hypothetical protein